MRRSWRLRYCYRTVSLLLTSTGCLIYCRRSLPPRDEAPSVVGCRARNASLQVRIPLHMPPVSSPTHLLYPRATQLLTSVIRGMNPTALFASLALQRNTQVQMHRDAGNEPNTANTAIPCSRWRGGSLWVQSDGGAYALDRATGPGTMIRIGLPYAQFPPHRFHATVPWSGGDRTILLGFTPRRMERLLESDRTQLTTLGFQLHAATECRFECSNTAVG